ncbi:MAG TPA: hypothetical protein ENI23_13415 [bacterium]|nr:hypothetical protein [bacterium]
MVKIGGHTLHYGHCYKLCPYALSYKEKYYDANFLGNSTNLNLPIPDAQITEHTLTSGTMLTQHRGSMWGSRCDDPACYYFITFGRQYFEV